MRASKLQRWIAMPLTKRGAKIKRKMMKFYGKTKGARVFFASANKGRIKGVHRARKK